MGLIGPVFSQIRQKLPLIPFSGTKNKRLSFLIALIP